MTDPVSQDLASQEVRPQTESFLQTSEKSSLEDLARRLASSHTLRRREQWRSAPGTALTRFLDDYADLIEKAIQHFRGASEEELAVSYAAEWMLDNKYILDQALREIAEDLPLHYYRQLPKLAGGTLDGLPRIYALAREWIVYEHVHLDTERLQRFVEAYQGVTQLTMGELWALPNMLRLGIIQSLALSVSRLTGLPVSSLKGQPVFIDLSSQVSDDDVVANSIISLRTLAAEDWKDFFESTSLVELVLRRDPAGCYAGMDFETRDAYRKAIEACAPQSGADEQRVAKEAIRLSQEAADWIRQNGPDADHLPRTAHVGYYLVDRGRAELERQLGIRTGLATRLKRWVFAHPATVYLGAIGSLSVLTYLPFLLAAVSAGGEAWSWLLAGGLLSIPVVTLAVNLVNWGVTRLVKPKVLPKMDFEEGIPPEHAALVVIPALLAGPGDVKSLLQQIELHYLRNPDPNLCFALLTDFADALEPRRPEDDALLEAAQAGIQALNQRYPRQSGAPFFLFHRPRKWNASEERWMGWERKRGKLHELNRLILNHRAGKHPPQADNPDGDELPSFLLQVGDLDRLGDFRYVITLDADTILPRESGQQLVATLAHPLNQPVIDMRGRVIAGYALLQPRTEISPTSANQSIFTRIFAGDTGLDLYTRAVSDVYQDLFGEGIYVGKGIYDVEAFERSLDGRVPENALLSHDLFEGIFARVALVTDIVLIEDFPANYLLHVRRLSRWIRGDWQLLPWLFPRVPAAGGRRVPNTLTAIDRWKIVDNLRRSLLPPFVFALFGAAWTGLLPGSTWTWTLIGLLTPAAPLFSGPANALIQVVKTGNLRALRRSLEENVQRWLLAIVFLPYESLITLEAVGTTLVRLYVTRKHLLRWTTSAQAALHFGNEVASRVTWQQMLSSLVWVLTLAAVIWISHIEALIAAAPLLIAWLLSPEVVSLISRPLQIKQATITPEQRQRLRVLARQTWLFFEQYVGPEDHWLPPDHFQEFPLGVVAHRTSPTNIGLAMVSTLAAYDLGYIGLLDLVARLRASFETMEGMERYRGHFLNWYDTRSLEPLPPRYVSTVDSGNLAACLIVLQQGCQDVTENLLLRWEMIQGLVDLLQLLDELLASLKITSPQVSDLRAVLAGVIRRIDGIKDSPAEWVPWLLHFSGEGNELSRIEECLMALVESSASDLGVENLRKLRIYIRRTQLHIHDVLREIEILLPWLLSLADPPPFFRSGTLDPELQDAWEQLLVASADIPSLQRVEETARAWQVAVERLSAALAAHFSAGEQGAASQDLLQQEAIGWCENMAEKIRSAILTAKVLKIGLQELARTAEAYVQAMDFRFLFDERRQIFHIGYNVATEKLDNNYYDLLASEARIASLVAIAKEDVPQSHWLHLGRAITQVDGVQALLSWSATMFEYLMPLLFLRNYPGTLLAQTAEAALERQIAYGEEKRVPWGVSESGYYRFDANQAYQYRAFGVPGLGYKRGLGEDLVITPYASLLALPLKPQAVLQNIERLEKLGMLGIFGFYEAIDFTPSRTGLDRQPAIVRSYMAHHQGMIFLSIGNFITGDRMVQRFHASPRIQSVDLLLQEQIPQDVPIERLATEHTRAIRPAQPRVTASPWRARLQVAQPRVHFLTNGRYGVLIASTGSGYSTWRDIDLTRWRADTTLNPWGTWVYVKDLDSGALWSAAHLPTAARPQTRDVYFNAHMAEFHRRDGDISLVMEITVPPEEDLEIRKITLTNHGSQRRRLFLASYGEVILAPQDTDARHPAFNKLFIESEWVSEANALLFRRRPRSEGEKPIFLAHALAVEQGMIPTGLYETDRARFLGRGNTGRHPQALMAGDLTAARVGENQRSGLGGVRFSQTVGATLDPVFSIGQAIILEPHETAQVAYLTLAARSRQEALAITNRYQSWYAIQRAFDHARSQAEVELVQLGLDMTQLERIQVLLSLLLYPHEALRVEPGRLAANSKGQPGLWAYGISGDYPILLVRVYSQEDLLLAREAVQAHAYWRNRQIKIDLVLLNEEGTSYGQELNIHLHRLVQGMHAEAWLERRGGIFILPADRLGEADRILLETAARVILDARKGNLAQQLEDVGRLPVRLPEFIPSLPDRKDSEPTPALPRPVDLRFDNGLGGFSPDGREYQIYLEPGSWTPAPWINVIANPNFGFLVSEAGSGYTWAENSGENRLTPWANDPVSDPTGEALYLRDEESGLVWSPTPLPARADAPYLVRHGAGYTIFEHASHGLNQTLRLFVDPQAPVKIIHLRLENTWTRVRRLTATCYAEWVLGVNRESSQQYVIPEFDAEHQVLMARNPYNVEFAGRVAFLAASKTLHGLTVDRTEFLGRAGSLARPAALHRIGLSGTVRAGLDPCAALQVHVDLQPGEAEDVYFVLGQGDSREEAIRLATSYRDAGKAKAAWEATIQLWEDLLGAVCVQTPEPAMDLLLNRWLFYQTLACRIWGRSALYQSSGAYGFRDQLQDVMAMILARPEIARQHLLRAASRQFEAGDVLHWWHPPSGRGIRTRISDDLLWLPYVAAYYAEVTGDDSLFGERAPYLKGLPLEPAETERYGLYASTGIDGAPYAGAAYSFFEHCRRALERGTTSGPHRLPLIGTGDWNDGMNRVGEGGKGESVWLGWFLYDTLSQFAAICERRNDTRQAELYRKRAAELARALEENAWDGAWYLRAFYDDGTPLGSAKNQECQIDSIAQSWAVLSKAAHPERARRAMESVLERLVREKEGLILLFTPPFDKTSRDPGYIKGYLPGIRENGGQYTHAALWAVWAFTELGDGDTAERLFRMLNPIYHADHRDKIQVYKVEPYVVAADVYGVDPHTGRGGWTWYTGSAGWMYRLGVEAILGLRRRGNTLIVDPCIPRRWPGYELSYRSGQAVYHIRVENPQRVCRGVRQVILDGTILPDGRIPLAADGQEHQVRVIMGQPM